MGYRTRFLEGACRGDTCHAPVQDFAFGDAEKQN